MKFSRLTRRSFEETTDLDLGFGSELVNPFLEKSWEDEGAR